MANDGIRFIELSSNLNKLKGRNLAFTDQMEKLEKRKIILT